MKHAILLGVCGHRSRPTCGGEGHALLEPDVVDREVARARADRHVGVRPQPNANDPDGDVDHDERLKVTGVKSGAYDARLKLADGRVCMAKGVHIEAGKVFTIEEKELVGCAR